jgi:uncharacterized membrane protein YeaQ/YmgE (transglycosylase-associated protein family)
MLLSWLLCGLIVGFIARLLVPGRHRLGLLWTIVLGIAGSFLGGLAYWAFNHHPGEPFSLSGNAWQGWILSILGAAVLLLIFSFFARRRSSWW